MNRRLFVALVVLVPFVAFGVAKWATRWRPVRVAPIAGAAGVEKASERHLTVLSGDAEMLFDLQTGATRRLGNEGIAARGAWSWRLTKASKNRLQLELRQSNGPIASYPVPANFGGVVPGLGPSCVRVSPEQNRLEMLLAERYSRWNLHSRRLERSVKVFEDGFPMATTIARDGESVVSPDFGFIEIASTRRAGQVRTVPLAGVRPFEYIWVSPFGAYALYDAPSQQDSSRFNVVDAQTGRALWQFELDSLGEWAEFSPDEKWLALPLSQRKIWQIRDARTGAIVRTLPLVPGAHSGAFSPDGATLYSVADGVLYRQRAR